MDKCRTVFALSHGCLHTVRSDDPPVATQIASVSSSSSLPLPFPNFPNSRRDQQRSHGAANRSWEAGGVMFFSARPEPAAFLSPGMTSSLVKPPQTHHKEAQGCLFSAQLEFLQSRNRNSPLPSRSLSLDLCNRISLSRTAERGQWKMRLTAIAPATPPTFSDLFISHFRMPLLHLTTASASPGHEKNLEASRDSHLAISLPYFASKSRRCPFQPTVTSRDATT